MKIPFLLMALVFFPLSAQSQDSGDAAVAALVKHSPDSARWAQKRCGEKVKAEAVISPETLSACAKGRLRKLLTESEKMREQDDAEEMNPHVPHESWNRGEPASDDRDQDGDAETSEDAR